MYSSMQYIYNYIMNNNNYNHDTFDFYNYKDILEFLPTQKKKIKEQNILHLNNPLINSIKEYCNTKNNQKFIVSLSGGVDSMVLITILVYLEIEIVAIHINYNNRPETKKEQTFIEDWCVYNNIKLYVKSIDNITRSNTKRSDYETITKKIRFDFYKQISQTENINYVLLAHHKDDIVENIFANVCRGRNILDLAVIKQNAIINNVNIGRPMIDYYKNTIYEFANIYQVPYFKDTTPNWSVRGKYRNNIFPQIEDAFTSNIKDNLLGLSIQSDEWNSLIYQEIITPYINSIIWNKNEYDAFIVSFNIEKYIDYPLSFWNLVFMNIFNRVGYGCPSKKGILTFINTIKKRIINPSNIKYNITLCNKCKCTIKKYTVTIEF